MLSKRTWNLLAVLNVICQISNFMAFFFMRICVVAMSENSDNFPIFLCSSKQQQKMHPVGCVYSMDIYLKKKNCFLEGKRWGHGFFSLNSV